MRSTPEGDKQLTDIFLLFAEAHYQRAVSEPEFGGLLNHMLRYDSKHRYPMLTDDDAATFGELKVWYRHCDLLLPIDGYTVALRARLRYMAHGEYAVSGVFPGAPGKARHEQLAELATVLVTRCSVPGRVDALFDALNRMSGHWETVLRDWVSQARAARRPGVMQEALV